MGIGGSAQKDIDGSLDAFEVLHIVYELSSHYGGRVILPHLMGIIARRLGVESDEPKAHHRVETLVRRRIEKLKEMGFVRVEKIDGFIWVSPTLRAIHLIEDERNSNSIMTYREKAVSLLRMVNPELGTGYLSRTKDNRPNRAVRLIVGLFVGYVVFVDNVRIVLVRDDVPTSSRTWDALSDSVVDDADVIVLPYRTRFNDKGMVLAQLKKYDSLWDTASKLYDKAVFVTLTTDPKLHQNLYESIRHFSKAFNKFQSMLARRFGHRLPYIAVYEFTKTGLLHVHVVFFGVSHLMPQDELADYWEKRARQGRVVYLYQLRRTRDGKWVWRTPKNRPRDSKSRESVDDYLRKYLKKTLRFIVDFDPASIDWDSDDGLRKVLPLALYWVTRKRFFTYSRSLSQTSLSRQVRSVYRFFGVFLSDNVPDWVWLLPHRVYPLSRRVPPPA